MSFKYCGMSGSGIAALLFLFSGATQAAPPDLTNGGVPADTISTNLGPTGLRGWVYHVREDSGESRQILIQAVDVGSPADGKLAIGDVILGANGTGAAPVNFSADARPSFANAINDAEARSPAKLKVLRWRAGTTTTETLTLRTLGAYTATAPYSCPKSAQILEEGLQSVMTAETAGRYSFGTLSLLAGNNPANPNNAARRLRVQTEARALIPNAATLAKLSSGEPDMGASTWQRGHELIVLTEYYLQTNDALVLPTIEALSKSIIAGQNAFGTMGHKFAPKWRDGSPNGPLRRGYGAVNSAAMPTWFGLLLARECGVSNPDLSPAIARAGRFFAYYSGKGAIPYGEHEAYWQGHDNNGKSGLAALCFELEGSRGAQQKMFAKMAVAATTEREVGHTGSFFNYLWSPIGAAAGGEAAAASYFSRARWMLDLNRRWNGSFVYDCLNGEGPTNGATYNDFRMSTAALLVYALPLRQLHITGRGHDSARWLSAQDIGDAAAVDGYNPALRSTSQLMTDLGSWSPRVQRRAAEEIDKRTTETTALLPALHAMATDAQGTARVGACFALGYIGHTSSGPVLAGLLTDPSNVVRFAAAEGMRFLPTAVRTAHLNAVLAATTSTAMPVSPPNEEDPLHFAHGRLAMLLFYGGNAYGPKGIIWNNLTGVDRNLLYPAIRAAAATPVGLCRSSLKQTYDNLIQTDYLALADTVVRSAYEITPADKMFSGAERLAALRVLERFNAAEGVPLSVLTLQDKLDGFNTDALAVLQNYAGGSTTVQPDPGVEAALNFLIQSGINVTEAQAVLNAIAADPNPVPLASLKSIQSVVPDASSLTLPAKWTVLSATTQDYAKGDSVYTWRKIHGAGGVTFTPNGTAAAKDTTVLFDGVPGRYLFEVRMSDSKNLTEVFSTVAVTLKNPGGTLPANLPPLANAQSPAVTRDTPTPVTLSGSDPEGYALNFRITTELAQGTLTGTAPYLVYTPEPGYTGADSFAFEVQDSEGQTASATVSVTVTSGAAVPVAIYEPFDYAIGALNVSGTTSVGLGGTWSANSSIQIAANSLTHGSLPVSGNSVIATGASNTLGGSRAVNASALAATGLLNDGATLWFSAVVGTDISANMTNMRLGFALATSSFSTGSYQYYITNAGGNGLGFTFGRLDAGEGSVNGKFAATRFRDSTFGTSGWDGNVIGSVPPTYLGGGQKRLIVGKLIWGASSDTIELYEPDTALNLGTPRSTLTVNVNQAAFDTLTFCRSERITLDEIRFGGNYHSVLVGSVTMTADTTPPTPNPASFQIPPIVSSSSTIDMVATAAYDPNGVEYYFTCTGAGADSGWQASPSYTATALTPGVAYSYTAKSRDLSPARNESTASPAASATIPLLATVPNVQGMIQSTAQAILAEAGLIVGTLENTNNPGVPAGRVVNQSLLAGQTVSRGTAVSLVISGNDTTPPAPSPMAWASTPAATGQTSIAMTATAASDASGVEYYFTCVAGGGQASGWQDSPVYLATGLNAATQYTYTVTARDKSSNQNATQPSAPSSATTPPANGTWIFDGDDNWSNATRWTAATVASGTDVTASFVLNLTGNRTVTLDGNRSIGHIVKTDTVPSDHTLTIGGSANTLTLATSSGAPSITNNDAGEARRFVISRPLAGTNGLTLDGGGVVLLGNNSTSYTGATQILNGSFVDFGGIPNANLGGGAAAGRNISLSAGSIVRFGALDNPLLNRLVETVAEVTVMTGSPNANSLDFSSSTGANLPNAFLGNWASNGAKAEYTGTLTPAADHYRLGGKGSNGLLGIRSLLTGTQGLVVGGTGASNVRVSLVAANTFSGDTVINTGARLGIGNNLALQNSALDAGATGGSFSLAAGTNGGRIVGETAASSPTFGGLKGSRHLLAVFTPSGGNNETNLAATAVTGFTLNPGTGKTCNYSGAIANFAPDTTLTKSGLGTQILDGINTYTGATHVSQGVLGLGANASISNSILLTIAPGAVLDTAAKPTYPIPAAQPLIFGIDATGSGSSGRIAAGELRIADAMVSFNFTGTLDDPAYVLATYTSLQGTAFASPPTLPSGYVLDYAWQGNKIALVQVIVSPYDAWSGGAPFEADANNDGIANGIAWVLGAADPAANATALLPTLDSTSDPDFFIFNHRRSDTAAANSTLKVQFGSDLAGWTDAIAGPDVIITPANDFHGIGTDKVEVKIRRILAAGGKFFARLHGAVAP